MTTTLEPPASRWSLEIFQMSSPRRQQRALHVFGHLRIPGVQVLGAARPDGSVYLVVDAARIADCVRSRRIIASVDPSSSRVHTITPQDVASRSVPDPRQPTGRPEGVPLRVVPREP